MNLCAIKKKPEIIFLFPHRVFRAYLRSLHPEELKIVQAYLMDLTATDAQIAAKVGLPLEVCRVTFLGVFEKLVRGLELANLRRKNLTQKGPGE